MSLTNLHPDDLLFFNEVRAAMFRVAKNYALPLRSVEAMSMPEKSMIDRLGDCSATGDIRLVMRATVDGRWCEAPRTPERVWETAAHELAHLKHFNHGPSFQEFTLELIMAMRNQTEDHREKVIRKLVKLQAQAQGEKELGNIEAAEAFAGAVNRMLIEYELNPSDIDYARVQQDDPVIELMVDLSKYRIEKKNARSAWQESLARVVAKANLCTWLLRSGSNQIWFVGTRSHATVAEYVYGILVPAAAKMSQTAGGRFRDQLRKQHGIKPSHSVAHIPEARGFREAWLNAFVERIAERMDEARRAAVKAVVDLSDVPGAESQALMRLDGALVKAQRYVDEKFKSRRRSASMLYRRSGWNAAGRAAGRAAADAMPIGTRGLNSAASGARGLLK